MSSLNARGAWSSSLSDDNLSFIQYSKVSRFERPLRDIAKYNYDVRLVQEYYFWPDNRTTGLRFSASRVP